MHIRFHMPKPSTIRFYFGLTEVASLTSDKITISKTLDILRNSKGLDANNLPVASGYMMISWTGWHRDTDSICPPEAEYADCAVEPNTKD